MEQARSDELKLCTVCSEFYGSAATNYLCSKCYRSENNNANAAADTSAAAQDQPIQAEP